MRRGISLIVLIVTIIVLIILTGVTINELTNKDAINETKLTAYLADWNTFKNEMLTSFGNETIKNLSFDNVNINATWDGTGNTSIRKWIPSFKEEYKDEIVIIDGKLEYIGSDSNIVALLYNERNGETRVTIITVEPTSTINHSAEELTMDWSVLGKIADKIAQTNTITYTTEEIRADVNGTQYTIGVGDTKILTYDGTEYTARILGFNHDTIVNTNNKAGISFEFTSCTETAPMNTTNRNTNGYEAMPLRENLNSTYYNKIDGSVKELIKNVAKEYIKTYNNASSVTTSATGEKLWLLSCSEIYNTGYQTDAYGNAITKEGNQYRYYAKTIANSKYSNAYSKLIKQYNGSNQWYWLRSPYYSNIYNFCRVYSNGSGSTSSAEKTGGVAFGFSI